MRILMTLANPFITDTRVYYESESLISTGNEVTILAWDKKKLHPLNDTKDGIKIVRSYNTNLIDILPRDIFKMHLWWKKGYKDAVKLHNKKPFDVIHSHDLDTLPIGVKLKKKFGLPLIYDAHEIWGYMVNKDLPKWWANYYIRKEKKLLNYVDQVITVNEPVKKYLEKLNKKPITLVMNCKPLISKNYEPTKNKKLTLIYIGGLKNNRFISELIDVVSDLSDVKLIVAGYKGRKNYIDKVKKKINSSKNIEFLGRISIEDVIPLTKKSDVVILMTDPDDLNASILTANKQFEAMVAGRPIICSKNTYPGKFTENENVGITADYSKDSLKKAIIKLRDNPKLREELGKNALTAAIKKYNWKIQEERLLKVYENLK